MSTMVAKKKKRRRITKESLLGSCEQKLGELRSDYEILEENKPNMDSDFKQSEIHDGTSGIPSQLFKDYDRRRNKILANIENVKFLIQTLESGERIICKKCLSPVENERILALLQVPDLCIKCKDAKDAPKNGVHKTVQTYHC